jgi:hypothetical protein
MTHTPNTAVTLERLALLLDAYGGEPARWPEAERAAALQLIAANPQAVALQRAALELDGALDLHLLRMAAEAADAQLRARVLEIPIRHARAEGAHGWGLGRSRNWVFALFALTPCVLGFLSGTLLMDPAADSDDEGWEELAQVVMPGQATDELDMYDEETP